MSRAPSPWPIVDDREPPASLFTQPCAEPCAEPDLIEEANRTAGLCVLGLVVGVVVTKLVDFAIGGPGLLVMVGL